MNYDTKNEREGKWKMRMKKKKKEITEMGMETRE
jgi:hypothetical protein